ncbi:hypothetical protein FO519_009346 [Halicephalobus sp. NKZ332]|nr:hypothetical protein FO519_009346 [Halicephalobus sp. NKZ332]
MTNSPSNVPKLPDDIGSWKNSDEWVQKATEFQNQRYIENAGRMYEVFENYNHIEIKILTCAFGTVSQPCQRLALQLNHCYNQAQRKIAIEIRKKIQQCSKSKEVFLNVIYIVSYLEDEKEITIPVFYFKTPEGIKYIDIYSRIYRSWEHFLETNLIKPSLCCYPVKGYYGEVQSSPQSSFNDDVKPILAVDKSHSCALHERAIEKAEDFIGYAGSILNIASVVSTIASHKWVARLNEKIVMYAKKTQSYIGKLRETIDENSKKELGNDLDTKNQSDLSPIARYILKFFSTTRRIVSKIPTIIMLLAMLRKAKCGESDYFNLASSIFTSYGIVISPLIAKRIFERIKSEYNMELLRATKLKLVDTETENDKIEKKVFENHISTFINPENEYVMDKELCRRIESIDDVEDLFCEIILIETTLDLKEKVLFVDGQLKISGTAFAEMMEKNEKLDIREKIKVENEGSKENYIKGTQNYDEKEKYRYLFEVDIQKFEETMNSARINLKNIIVGQSKIFEDMNIDEYNKLIQKVDKVSEKECIGNFIDASVVLANELELDSIDGFCACYQILFNE